VVRLVVIERIGGPDKIIAQFKANQKNATEKPAKTAKTSDQVSISSEAKTKLIVSAAVKRASAADSEIRQDIVEAAKAKVASGEYETPEAIKAVAVELSKLLAGGE
jgi:anti-sigma28 factor (negative regulator of flagellin synthesis)